MGVVIGDKKMAWWLCGIYVLFIISTLSLLRSVSDSLRFLLGDFFDMGVSFLLLIVGLTIFVLSLKKIRHNHIVSKILFVFSLLSYLAGLYYLDVPEERIHLLEYGLLAFLVLNALQFDLKKDIYLY